MCEGKSQARNDGRHNRGELHQEQQVHSVASERPPDLDQLVVDVAERSRDCCVDRKERTDRDQHDFGVFIDVEIQNE